LRTQHKNVSDKLGKYHEKLSSGQFFEDCFPANNLVQSFWLPAKTNFLIDTRIENAMNNEADECASNLGSLKA
jgi:hypothetical protein